MGSAILVLLTFLIMAAAGVFLSGAAASKENEQRKRAYEEKIDALIQAHTRTLHTKKLQTIRRDAYGNIFYDKWEKEKAYFYEFVVKPNLGLHIQQASNQVDPYTDLQRFTSEAIEKAVQKLEKLYSVNRIDVDKLTPYEFENFCAQLLNEAGWKAQVTQKSGDQGIDIIGERNGIKAVFQVKKHASPIGNKAVQEAIAGKAFASADVAFVVSNSSFTPSARQLADVSGVELLHYSRLKTLNVGWKDDI